MRSAGTIPRTMDLDNARALKERLTGQVTAFAGRAVSRAEIAYAATRSDELDPLPRTIAVGLARRRGSDYVIAIRLQRQGLVEAPHVERIRERAKNEVDIRYIGRISKRAAYQQGRHRPLEIGLSIGHYRVTAGTLGGFVKLRRSGAIRMLSNNHVFADENRGTKGDAIVQPGAYDGGRTPADRVGRLAEFERVRKTKPNVIDAALATVDVDYKASALRGHGKLRGVLLDATQARGTVEKIGRTTGHTTGRITAFEVNNVVVSYGSLGNLRFDGQIEIEGVGAQGFSDGGDSGSIIYTTNGHLAIGLLFAGGETGGSNNMGLTFANPIGMVLDGLKADLLL